MNTIELEDDDAAVVFKENTVKLFMPHLDSSQEVSEQMYRAAVVCALTSGRPQWTELWEKAEALFLRDVTEWE
jgi:hypothetical protein